MRVIRVALVLSGLAIPGTAVGQAATVAYQPNTASARLAADANAVAAQDTVTVDPYQVDNTVAYGAAVGGLLGALAVAAHTLGDDTRDPMSWGAAIGIPILGGLVGAGVGYLIR